MTGAPGLPELNLAGRGTAVQAMLGLKSATDFERVRRAGRSHAHPLVVLIALRRTPTDPLQPITASRFGFVAGKGAGIAVARNRAKRLLREAARACAAEVEPGWDLVFIARRPLAAVRQAEATPAVRGLLRRARVLRDEQGTVG
ncbi:MAG: ribonuclease P protein component [Anaerolineales bacterium]